MMIRKLVIENLFAYYGHNELDLSEASASRPIIVIMGRNGHGKTCLLKSLWLLFLGPEHRLLREIGYRERSLGPRQVLLGTDDDLYQGALNTRAKWEQESDRRFGVSATIVLEDGAEAVVERYWSLNDGAPDGKLTICMSNKLLEGPEAEAFIASRFPSAVVPYFFFDGEKIQEIAESRDSARTEHIEQILGLRHAIFFEEKLNEIARRLGRARLQENLQAELDKSVAECNKINAELRQIESNIEDQYFEIDRLQEKERILGRRIENLTGDLGLKRSEQSERRINELTSEFERRRSELIESYLPILPVFSDHALFHSASDIVQKCYEYHHQNIDRIFEDLLEEAPVQIFERGRSPTPPLTPGQRGFLKEKLVNYLRSAIGYRGKEDIPDWQLSGDRTHNLSQKFSVYVHTIQRDRDNAWKILSDLSECLRNIKTEKESRLNIQSRTESEREEISQIRSDKNEISQALDNAHRITGSLEEKKRNLIMRQKRLEDNREKIDLGLREAIRNDSKASLAIKLARFVKTYRNETRRRHRHEIEERLNTRFVELFSGHRHIERLTVDDEFVIRAQDARGSEIPVIGVSHGMRQLMATALLWSITEQSRYVLPVFIDTPLARLDRDNQERLLTKYYPETSDQVILLATDSELDQRKLSLIQNRIGSIQRIHNPEGDAASFQPCSIQEASG